jgi:hypothetical protein
VRIAWTSDLHADLSERNVALLPHLAHRVAELDADAFVVAGDVAETVAGVEEALQAFAPLPLPRLYVPGNHDLFAEPDASGGWIDSRTKHEVLLPQHVGNAGFRYLGIDPIEIPPVTFVGTCGWFDATLQDPGLAAYFCRRHFESGIWRGLRAYDSGHVLWPATHPAPGMPCSLTGSWATDAALCDIFVQQLQAQLDATPADALVVAVVHVLAFPELVHRGTFGPSGFYDAWLGSARLGDRLRRDRRVRLVISGHQHRVADLAIRQDLRAVARPIGDARKSDLDLAELARERVGVLDIA